MTMIKVAGFLLDGVPLKDVTPSETVLGTALADSKPIEGTDLHEAMVEIGAPGMTVGAFPCMKCQWKRCGVRGEVCSECLVTKDFGIKHVNSADLLAKWAFSVADNASGALADVEKEIRRLERRVASVIFLKLATGFEMLWQAMNSERGCRMLNEELVRNALALCPRDLDRRGFAVCLIADFERNGQFDPMVRDAWKHLKPARYATDIAEMIRNQVIQVGWKGPNKNPVVGIYERALKQPTKTEGPWRWRKGARQ